LKLLGRAKLVASLVAVSFIALSWVGQSCDTWVALPDSTRAGATLLAKNSDRPTYDSQPLVLNPRATWPQGSVINLGRLAIPQVEVTHATLGSKPYWCWGYEEGVNEYGVAIGNEGVWTRPLMGMLIDVRTGLDSELGLTGMDLVRLGLERGRTAEEAMNVMVALLEEYGQFGSGIPGAGTLAGSYDNSYIIADLEEVWILETAGREWVARRIASGVASISNDLSIEAEFDLSSENLVRTAAESEWFDEEAGSPFSFAEAYRDPSPIGQGKAERSIARSETSRLLMEERAGAIDASWMMRIGRDRSSSPSIDQDATASSCVAVLPTQGAGLPVFWWAPTRPSVSCYVPFFVHSSDLPASVSRAGTHTGGVVAPSTAGRDSYAEGSYWWTFRDLSDLATGGVTDATARVRAAFDPLEERFREGLPSVLAEAERLRSEGRSDEAAEALAEFSAQCVVQALAVANELREELRAEAASQEIPVHLEPYVGTYEATFDDRVYTVKVKGGHLAVDVPGQSVYELRDPDETGRWGFALTDDLAVSFELDQGGTATSLILHQNGLALEFLREGFDPAIEVSVDSAEELVGEYVDQGTKASVEILYQNGRLAVSVDGRTNLELHLPDADGIWRARATEQIAVQFKEDSSGKTVGLVLLQGSEQGDYRKVLAGS
jgi:secernin